MYDMVFNSDSNNLIPDDAFLSGGRFRKQAKIYEFLGL